MSVILNIAQYPEKVLRAKCDPVVDFDEKLANTVECMFATLKHSGGCGLAAPQVFINKRIAVVDYDRQYVLINPTVLVRDNYAVHDEKCLSFCGMNWANVERPTHVELEAFNADGERFTLAADGTLARIFDHEIEHLDGILLIDHLSNLKRNMLDKKMRKRKSRLEKRRRP